MVSYKTTGRSGLSPRQSQKYSTMRQINVQTVAPQAFKCILELSLVKIYATFITAFKLAKSDAENS